MHPLLSPLILALLTAWPGWATTITFAFDPDVDVEEHLVQMLEQAPARRTLIELKSGVVYLRGPLVLDLSGLPLKFRHEFEPVLGEALEGRRLVGGFKVDARRARVIDFSSEDFRFAPLSAANRHLARVEAAPPIILTLPVPRPDPGCAGPLTSLPSKGPS